MTAVCVAVVMATLDTAIVNTALPTIGHDIGTSAASSIWIVNAYQLAAIAALLPLASLGEIVGHRRVYLAGLVLFTLTSLACGLAWSLSSLVVARAAQGLGAAAIMSVNAALIRYIYPRRSLGRALGLNALAVGVAFTVGPTVASAILSIATWHWLFLINVPAGLLAMGLAWRTLPATDRTDRHFDLVAAALCAAFFALLILGLGAMAHQQGWPVIVITWVVVIICGVALAVREHGRTAPLLAVDLFQRRAFSLSAVTSICSFATQGLAFVSIPFLLQDVMGRSQVMTGLLMTPWPAVVAIMAPIAGRLSDRFAPGILGGIGLIILSFGMASMALLPASADTSQIVWRMLVCGAGFGFFQAPNLKAIMESAPPHRSGSASGIIAVCRLLGQSIGTVLVAFCLTIAPVRGTTIALWMGCVFAALGCIASVARVIPGRAPAGDS
jgi:DHA2 family multidrug resistance protein-like MFS transporter